MGRIYTRTKAKLTMNDGSEFKSIVTILFDPGCNYSAAFDDLIPKNVVKYDRSPMSIGLGGGVYIVDKECNVTLCFEKFQFVIRTFIYSEEAGIYSQESEYERLHKIIKKQSQNHRYRIDFIVGALDMQYNRLILFPSIHGFRLATENDMDVNLWISADEDNMDTKIDQEIRKEEESTNNIFTKNQKQRSKKALLKEKNAFAFE